MFLGDLSCGSSGYVPRNRIAGSYDNSIFHFFNSLFGGGDTGV
jgi:hypothetical protein